MRVAFGTNLSRLFGECDCQLLSLSCTVILTVPIQDLLAQYQFLGDVDDTVTSIENVAGNDYDLSVDDSNTVEFNRLGLQLNAGSYLSTSFADAIDLIKNTEAFSIEAWVVPTALTGGPSRIVSISDSPQLRNVLIGTCGHDLQSLLMRIMLFTQAMCRSRWQ